MCARVNLVVRRAMPGVDTGPYVGTMLWVLLNISDPCPFGLPRIFTVAHVLLLLTGRASPEGEFGTLQLLNSSLDFCTSCGDGLQMARMESLHYGSGRKIGSLHEVPHFWNSNLSQLPCFR